MALIVKLDAPFVPWKDGLSSTTAAVQMDKGLRLAGHHDVLNLGQGREMDEPPQNLFPKNYRGTHATAYNSDVGGGPDVREAAAGYVRHFLGADATADNTFVLQQNGRVGIGVALSYASVLNTKADAVAYSADRWPMYDDIVSKIRGAYIIDYDNPTGDNLSRSLEKTLESGELFAFNTNTPHNPTGMQYPVGWMRALGEKLDSVNQGLEKPIVHIVDAPYFYALNPSSDSSQPYFNGGFQHVTRMDSPTPWALVVSESKALMSNPGLSIVTVHPSIVDGVKKALSSSVGVSYDPSFFSEVRDCFHQDRFADHAAHYKILRDKYQRNFPILLSNFSQQIVPGDPGMTALAIFTGMVGKEVAYQAPGGERHAVVIDSPERLAEYYSNAARVVTVPNGCSKDGNPKIRFALAQKTENFARAIGRIARANAKLLAAGCR